MTSALSALFEVAPGLPEPHLERLLGESDRLGLMGPDELRDALVAREGKRGAKALRSMLDRHSYRRTDSELEREFLRLIRRTNLPRPETQVWVCGLRVDFFWPDLGLVAETDGLRYHRTEAQQRSDRQRDRTLAAEGMVVLRFTHAEVFRESRRVGEELERVAVRRHAVQRPNLAAPRKAA